MQDRFPQIKIIEPNPDFEKFAEISPGKISDMIILHEHNVHYSLIIPENSRLAEEGSLDLQRFENAKVMEKKQDKKTNNESIEEKSMTNVLNSNEDNVGKDISERANKNSTDINIHIVSDKDEVFVSNLFDEKVIKENTKGENIQEKVKSNAGNEIKSKQH